MRNSFEPLNGLALCLCWEPHRFRWRSYFLALISFLHFGHTGTGGDRGEAPDKQRAPKGDRIGHPETAEPFSWAGLYAP